jgi:hypothetical protein
MSPVLVSESANTVGEEAGTWSDGRQAKKLFGKACGLKRKSMLMLPLPISSFQAATSISVPRKPKSPPVGLAAHRAAWD